MKIWILVRGGGVLPAQKDWKWRAVVYQNELAVVFSERTGGFRLILRVTNEPIFVTTDNLPNYFPTRTHNAAYTHHGPIAIII